MPATIWHSGNTVGERASMILIFALRHSGMF